MSQVERSANKLFRPEFGNNSSADVVIVGGGPAGVYLAGEMQKRFGAGSQGNIVLLEQKNELSGSSGASLQQFRTLQGDPILSGLIKRTVNWYERELGENVIDRFPYLFLARDEHQLGQYAADLQNVQQHGYGANAEMLKADELRTRYPFVDGELAGALLYPEAGRLDFDRAMSHIVGSSPNVTFALGTAMGEVDVKKGRVVGVKTDTGYIATERVVLCPGPFILRAPEQIVSGELLPQGDITKLVQVQKRQSFTAAVNGLPIDTSVYVISPEGAYVRLQALSGRGEGTYGYADPEDPFLGPHEIDPMPKANDIFFPAQVYSLLGQSISAYGDDDRSGRLAVEPIHRRAGYYVDTLDDLPLLSTTAIEGLYYNGAYSHHGVMAGQGGAEIMADMLTGKPNILYEHVSLGRKPATGRLLKI